LTKTLPSKASLKTANDGLFSGFNVYFAEGVPGKQFPKVSELKCIVENGGGTVLKKLGAKKVDQLLVVANDPDNIASITKLLPMSVTLPPKVEMEDYDGLLIISTKEFLVAVMQQEL